tara:strand:+ start:1689 stop:1928 length:240 start_codon:yes stop_codon:yes gene_type:complete
MFQDKEIKKLLDREDVLLKTLKEGELKITPVCVCESAAGFYLGTWCVERISNSLLPQPYERLSGYMSKEDAIEALPYYK